MNKKQSLDSDLNRYSQMTHTTLGHNSPTRKHLSEWALYTAAASSALALAPVAEASIIYSGVRNITLHADIPGLPQTNYITYWGAETAVDLDGDSHKDINLRIGASRRTWDVGGNHAYYSYYVRSTNYILGDVRFLEIGSFPSTQHFAYLRTNDTIGNKNYPVWPFSTNPTGAGPSWKPDRVTLRRRYLEVSRTASEAGWPLGPNESGTHIGGFAFFNGIQSHTQSNVKLNPMNFGWLRLNLTTDSHGNTQDLTLVDWAYQSAPGESIRVGDKGSSATPVPEPSTLALMALGAVGIGTLRRRRNREHSKQAQ